MKKYITTVRKLLSYLYLTPKAIVMSQWQTKGRVLIQLSAALPIKQEEKKIPATKLEQVIRVRERSGYPCPLDFLN